MTQHPSTPSAPLVQTSYDSPVGRLRIVGSAAGLRAILWPDDREDRVTIADPVGPDDGTLDEVRRQLDEYFDGTRRHFDLPLDPVGTAFQRSVWDALVTIDHGQTATYGELAAAIGRPSAARAVGAATGRNPISIVVPCHRLIGANGALTGFAGGIDAKRWLLAHEADRDDPGDADDRSQAV